MAGETLKAFASLDAARKKIALDILNDLDTKGDQGRIVRAIAYALSELRRLRGLSWPQVASKVQNTAANLHLPEKDIASKNLINFASRGVDRPTSGTLGLYALVVVGCLEDTEGDALKAVCFDDQLLALDWVRQVLSTAVKPKTLLKSAPAPAAKPGKAVEKEATAEQAITLSKVRKIFGERIVDYLSDDQVRQRLDWGATTDQAGYLCFRSALGQERMVVQSFLTILSPSRSQTPFWTFAHVYKREGHNQLRAAGGIVLTTTHALYLIGGEGWVDPEHAEEERLIYRTIKPTTLTMFSIPMNALGKKETTLPGVAMTANGKDEPIISRVALRRVNAMSHKDVLSLIPVEAFQDHLLDLATQGDRITIPGPYGKGRQDPLVRETDRILSYINNRPASHFLDATTPTGSVLKDAELLALIRKVFESKGAAKFTAPDGTPYRFDIHQWFHALDASDTL